jgi:hypothetical protein
MKKNKDNAAKILLMDNEFTKYLIGLFIGFSIGVSLFRAHLAAKPPSVRLYGVF